MILSQGMRNRFASHINFAFLRGFIQANPNVMPSNIDMVLERKGKFLFGEWKRPGENMNLGQEILLQKLAKIHTVLIITGDTDNGVNVTNIQQMCPFGKLVNKGGTAEDLKKVLNDWYIDADKTEK